MPIIHDISELLALKSIGDFSALIRKSRSVAKALIDETYSTNAPRLTASLPKGHPWIQGVIADRIAEGPEESSVHILVFIPASTTATQAP
jgi:hypothetical protein